MKPATLIITIAIVLGLSLGFIDTTISMLPRPGGLSSLVSILPPLAAGVCVFFLVYLVLGFLIVARLARLFELEVTPLAVSFALFLGTSFTLATLSNLIHFSLLPNDLFKLCLLILLCLLIFVAAYFATNTISRISGYRNIALAFSLATPFVLAELLVFVWIQKYRIGSIASVPSLLLWIGYLLVALLTIGLVRHTPHKTRIAVLLGVFLILVVLGPAAMWLSTRAPRAFPVALQGTDHEIKQVILITVDTLRADALSCYSQQKMSTPHIDQLAKDGVLFRKAISAAPWTLPSLGSIMTGLSPKVHMTIKRQTKLPDTLRTLAEYMREAGYYTAAIVSNPYLDPSHNLSQGFIDYQYFPKQSLGASLGAKLLKQLDIQFNTSSGALRDQIPTVLLTKLTVDWLESNWGKDFFLWIHYFDPHGPYAPPREYLPKDEPLSAIGITFYNVAGIRAGYVVPSLMERAWIKDLYDAEVRYVDDNIGKLLKTLKRLDLYDESLIILTSDHGEEFWEHDSFEHGHTLYDEVLSVPLIIKLPLSASKGRVSSIVSTPSIMPTVLDLCRIDYEHDSLSVASLSPLWRTNPASFKEQPLVSTGLVYYENRESVMFNGMKYIRFLETRNREELYDLARDPKERISLVSSSPDKIEQARDILKKEDAAAMRLRKLHGIIESQRIELDEEAIRRLKALGYMQ